MNLLDILAHPSFKSGDPIVRAGGAKLDDARVRWVHSREVLDIVPLLRGEELLLSGDTALAAALKSRRSSYVRELAAHHVSALAVETGSELPEIPSDIIQTAVEVGLPLIELRRVVPFVEIAESINSTLVSDSVSTLQRADAVSHAVAVKLEVSVSLLVPGTTSDELLEVGGVRANSGVTVDVEIAMRGIIAATLRMALGSSLQEPLVQSVGDRVADALSLALLQQRPIPSSSRTVPLSASTPHR